MSAVSEAVQQNLREFTLADFRPIFAVIPWRWSKCNLITRSLCFVVIFIFPFPVIHFSNIIESRQ